MSYKLYFSCYTAIKKNFEALLFTDHIVFANMKQAAHMNNIIMARVKTYLQAVKVSVDCSRRTNAVSDKFISAATCCIDASLSSYYP